VAATTVARAVGGLTLVEGAQAAAALLPVMDAPLAASLAYAMAVPILASTATVGIGLEAGITLGAGVDALIFLPPVPQTVRACKK